VYVAFGLMEPMWEGVRRGRARRRVGMGKWGGGVGVFNSPNTDSADCLTECCPNVSMHCQEESSSFCPEVEKQRD
jgi:hypothetical protein